MSGGNRISLHDLFKEAEKKNMQETSRAVIVDGKIETIPEVNLDEYTNTVMKREDSILKIDSQMLENGFLKLDTLTYDDYVIKSKEKQVQAKIERKNVDENKKDILDRLFGIDENIYSDSYEFVGYNKLGVNTDGEPYIRAMLSNQFDKLNKRRFLKEEEYEEVVNNRGRWLSSESVVNKGHSIKEIIQFEVRRDRDLKVNTVSIRDVNGNRIPYLEQKFDYIQEMGVHESLWVAYLRTKFEFEEDYKTIAELKDKEFNG